MIIMSNPVCGLTILYSITGGILFVIAFYTTEDGQHMGATEGGKNLLQTMHAI